MKEWHFRAKYDFDYEEFEEVSADAKVVIILQGSLMFELISRIS